MRRWLRAGVLLAGISLMAAQNADQNLYPTVPVITFECYWEPATPQHYVITVRGIGNASYRSNNPGRPSAQGQDSDYFLGFNLPAATHDQIFTLAEKANYFNGSFESKLKVANTGSKTLTYADPSRHYQTTFNYSDNRAVDELSRIFQGIGRTLEYGRRLQNLHVHDRLGLEAELEAMESDAKSHFLYDMELVAPTLKSLADDPAVMNIARNHARHLLKLAQTP